MLLASCILYLDLARNNLLDIWVLPCPIRDVSRILLCLLGHHPLGAKATNPTERMTTTEIILKGTRRGTHSNRERAGIGCPPDVAGISIRSECTSITVFGKRLLYASSFICCRQKPQKAKEMKLGCILSDSNDLKDSK